MSTSRTSDRSSIAGTIRAFSKQCAESATAFAHRYRYDVFYRTGWNVVLLQVGFTAVLLIVTLVTLSVLHEDLLKGIVEKIVVSATSGGAPAIDSGVLLGELEYTKEKAMVFAGTAVLILAAIFGWLIARLALTPTRNALTSQKQFVGNIAHELRTPLSIIKTNTEVALFNERLDEDTKEMLRSNVEELDRISGIINNLLSMNMLLRPEKIRFANVDLGPIVDRVKSALADLAELKRIEVATEIDERRTVWGNASGVEQIVMNIAKNALNYSPNGSRVVIRILPHYPGQIAVAIEDRGPGISEAELTKIFEPFYRGDSSRNRKSGGGSGLGLAIVNELVKIHSGRIAVKSMVGRGTTVTVYLPHGHGLPPEATPSGMPEDEVAMDFSAKKPASVRDTVTAFLKE